MLASLPVLRSIVPRHFCRKIFARIIFQFEASAIVPGSTLVAGHMRAAISCGSSFKGCKTPAAPIVPGAAWQCQHNSTRGRLSCHATNSAPNMPGKAISDMSSSRSGVPTRKPATPLRKTAKTTLYYAKPKPVIASNTELQTNCNSSSVTDTAQVDTSPPTQEAPQSLNLNSSQPVLSEQQPDSDRTSEPATPRLVQQSSEQEPVSDEVSEPVSHDFMQQESEKRSDVSGASEKIVHHIIDGGSSHSPSEAPGVAALNFDHKQAEGRTQSHARMAPVQVPSSVKRPWDNVPKPATLSGTVMEGGRQHRKALVAQPVTVDDADDDITSAYAYLRSRGLTELQAERLALELDGEGSPYADAATLRDQLCKLDRLLPGMSVNVLLCKDTLILTTDTSTAASRLVRLHSLLGSPNLASLLHVAPQLLYAEEVEERVEQCITRLMNMLPPDYDIGKLQRLLVEAPTIVFRMDHFGSEEDVTSLNDLPADLVNRLTAPENQDDACMSCLI